MELTLGERRVVTKAIATRYRRADKGGKGRILDELCATTGWHRNHARKALSRVDRPRIVRPRAPRLPKYGPDVIAALVICWAVQGMPAGKRLAPFLGELVATLRRFDELDITDKCAELLVGMSAATIDRRLAPERKKHQLRGRSLTKPGSLLKSQIPIRTWAQWDDASPGFVEIDLVGHEGKVLSVDFSPNSQLIASGSEDKSVRVWDANTARELSFMTGHTGAVRSVRFAPQGDLLASASDDGTIRLWRLQALRSSARELAASVGVRYRVELVGTRVLRTRSH